MFFNSTCSSGGRLFPGSFCHFVFLQPLLLCCTPYAFVCALVWPHQEGRGYRPSQPRGVDHSHLRPGGRRKKEVPATMGPYFYCGILRNVKILDASKNSIDQ